MTNTLLRPCTALAWALALIGMTASAQTFAQTPAAAEATPFKLTTGLYRLSGGQLPNATGVDVNLRYTSDRSGEVWLGVFRAPARGQDGAFVQTRTGWDTIYSVGPVRLQPSLQAASGGFWGGSVSVETGDSWYLGAGLGRTNLRTYVNLNFDPNDAWMLSGGYRWTGSRSLGLQVVRDNRQNPDQQHLHLVYRTALAEGHRLTLDALYKKGLVDGEPIKRLGLSATYDWPRFFARVAYDPKVNFTPQDMWRVQLGTRF